MKKISGIYVILNNINQKRYIGSSLNIKNRLSRHKKELERGVHCNKHLQNAYEKYKTNFVFEILELCPENILIEKETFFIEKYKTLDMAYGYNVLMPQEVFPKNINVYKLVGPDNKIYGGKNITKFAREHNLNNITLLGLINGSSRARTYRGWRLYGVPTISNKIKSPEGRIYTVKYNDQKKFCKEHNLKEPGLSSLIHGHQKTHRGWSAVND